LELFRNFLKGLEKTRKSSTKPNLQDKFRERNLPNRRHSKVFSKKNTPFHGIKAYGGSRGTAPLILNLCTRCRSVVNFTP
jgi:hypothetical protein